MADFPAGDTGTLALAAARIGFAGFPFSELVNEPALRDTPLDENTAVEGDPQNNPVDPEIIQPQTAAGIVACPDGLQSYGPDWFDRIHVFPRGVFDFGQIVSSVTLPYEVFSAFRVPVTLSSVVNNAQPGFTLPGFPSTPYVHPQFTSILDTIGFPAGSGLTPVAVRLEFLAEELGLPSFDTTIDFVYPGQTAQAPVTGRRTSLIVPDFERGFVEVLRYGTQRPVAISGKTKRVSLRPTSAQTELQLRFRHVGLERRILQAQFYDAQPIPLAIPLRQWRKPLTAAAAINDSTIQVDTTDAEFRVGQLAAVISDIRTADVLIVQSFDASSITFDSPLLNAYPAGTQVMPVRTGFLDSRLTHNTWRVSISEIVVTMRLLDDAIGAPAGDVSTFPTYNGRVLFDDDNVLISEQLPIVQERPMETTREIYTNPNQDAAWPQARESFPVVVSPKTRAQHVRYRRFLDYHRGGQVAFYIPSRFEELIVTRDLVDTTTNLYIENIGFARFLKAGPLRSHVRFTLTSGAQFTREITGGVVEDVDEELLTVSSPWTTTITPDEIERVEWLWLVTISSDAIRITHQDLGKARIEFAVQTEFDDQ